MSKLPFSGLFVSFLFALARAQEGEEGGNSDSGDGDSILYAHGIIGSLAFVVFFPLGAILLRVIRSSNSVWIHAGVQSFTLLLIIATVATGIHLAGETNTLDEYHPVIGLLFALVVLQWIGGVVHHLLFRKYHRRTVISHFHIWLGRTLITFGIINGGLGLLLADNSSTGEQIAYGVVGGIIWLAFVVVSVQYAISCRGPSKEGTGMYWDKRNNDSE